MLVTIAAGCWYLSPNPVQAQSRLGGPIPNLKPLENTYFLTGRTAFFHLWDPVQGQGPVFTQSGCVSCHTSPVAGGLSTTVTTFAGKTNSDGTFNGLENEGGPVIQRFSIMQFQPTCTVPGEVVPADATIVSGRIAPPTFGMGLVNSIPEDAIMAQAVDKGDGIHGMVNLVPDENGDIHVGRFGLKAQFASLLQFTAEATLHDLGITNPYLLDEDLPQGKFIPPICLRAAEPNDPDGSATINPFHFMEYLAPHTPGPPNTNGQAQFDAIGCNKCHLESYTTGPKVPVITDVNGDVIFSAALSNQPVNLYSDLLLHDMGPVLADGISQGQASGTQLRTTPLWGLAIKTRYLHDGRTTDIKKSITMHGGESTTVIQRFNALAPQDQNDLIAFIQSL